MSKAETRVAMIECGGADRELIYQALRFYFWAAGEGISPAEEENALEPEEGFWQYSQRTDDKDWETVAARYRNNGRLGNSGFAWSCAALKSSQGANDPPECNWPLCGCDPVASKVVAALEEDGLVRPPSPTPTPCPAPEAGDNA